MTDSLVREPKAAGTACRMLEKELRDHPETWHKPAHLAMFTALEKAPGCERAPDNRRYLGPQVDRPEPPRR
jgi:hypothetical protein